MSAIMQGRRHFFCTFAFFAIFENLFSARIFFVPKAINLVQKSTKNCKKLQKIGTKISKV